MGPALGKIKGLRYHLDRRIQVRQRQGGNGVHLEDPGGLDRKRFHLGSNKEVLDAETFAIYQALKIFQARQEPGHRHTVFSDSQPAIRRALSDAVGPGQWARAIIEVATEMSARGNKISLFWAPAHRGAAGNEFADDLAKEAAEGSPHHELEEALDAIRWQASLPHLSRRVVERRAREAT